VTVTSDADFRPWELFSYFE